MRFFKKGETYSWEFDRFHFFTESEKCTMLDLLKDRLELYETIPDFNVKGGLNDMIRVLIKELDGSLQCRI